jgi:hypothetical protein
MRAPMPTDDTEELSEIFAGLGLPQHALEEWLAELERFCRAHGGERRYRELMALLHTCRDAATTWRQR